MIPTETELIDFIKRRYPVNFTLIAKHFEINNATVSDLINLLIKKKKATVIKLGGSKIIKLK